MEKPVGQLSNGQALLGLALAIFGALSFYTTYEGLVLIWEPKTLVENMPPGALSLGLTLLLIYLNVSIARSTPEMSIAPLILAFVAVGGVSMFFNFNALFFRLRALDAEREELSSLFTIRDKLLTNARADLSAKLEMDRKVADVEAQRSLADFERTRFDRVGRGPLYQKELDKLGSALGQVQARKKLHDEASARLEDSGRSSVPTSLAEPSPSVEYSTLHAGSEKLRGEIARLEQQIAAEALPARLTQKERGELTSSRSKKGLWYSLSGLAQLFGANPGQLEQKSDAWIAAVLALLIDTPLFAVVLAVRGSRRPQVRGDAPIREAKSEMFPR